MTPKEIEHQDSLWRAFIRDKADFIVIYSKHQRWLYDCAEWAREKGWLTFEEVELDEQSTEYRYRLTPEGRKMLEVK